MFRRSAILWLTGLCLLAFLAAPSLAAERRVALVVGNAKYKESPLLNPVNDARDMAIALGRLGFEVIEVLDASQKEMNRAIARFGERLSQDSVALFYYAGHGVQVRGKNYLIPVDAQITNELSIRVESVDVDGILDQLSASDLSVLILDACRNNPFERRFRGAGGGLAQMDAPKGSLIAYATAPGRTAADGEGRNGQFTQALLKQIQTPGLAIEQVFKNVRREVARATRDAQIPWESSSLTGDFYFLPTAATAPAALANPPTRVSRVQAADQVAAAAVPATVSHGIERAQSAPEPRQGDSLLLASATVPASPAMSSPRPLPPAPTIAKGATAPAQQGKQPPPDAPTSPPPAPAAPLVVASVAPTSLASRESDRPQPADIPAVISQEQVIKVGNMTAVGRFTTDPVTGTLTGTGALTWTDGNRYEGPMLAGKKHGHGTFLWQNGQRYEGEWLDDQMTGKGILRFAEGSRYEGTVLAGKRQGSGHFVWPDGQRFEGEWSEDAINGQGILHYTNGDRYEGRFKNGEPHGTGTYTLKNGDRYEGEWLAGNKHGKGRLTWKSGDYWEGEFRDDRQTDNGKLVVVKPVAAKAKP